ncbi:MAG: arsenate reductase ArsC [Candidatus Hydrogenedentota bacterium]|nr:MAG: arsenate reductase ArsC [Candidatus Hydrogenedentota bacterium]
MKRVLFVCVRNACRSQMAEGFAKELGEGIIEAHSAGSQPSGIVNPKTVAAMREAGVDISSHESKGFDALPQVEWDVVVTMGCGDACPFLRAKMRIDWELPDPSEMSQLEFNRVRDEIRGRVLELIDCLENG